MCGLNGEEKKGQLTTQLAKSNVAMMQQVKCPQITSESTRGC